MEYFKNGVSMGVAFTDVDDGPLRPAISLIGECVLTLRFTRPKSTLLTSTSIPPVIASMSAGAPAPFASGAIAAENLDPPVLDGTPLPAASLPTPPRRHAVARTGPEGPANAKRAGSSTSTRPYGLFNHHASVYDEDDDSENE